MQDADVFSALLYDKKNTSFCFPFLLLNDANFKLISYFNNNEDGISPN